MTTRNSNPACLSPLFDHTEASEGQSGGDEIRTGIRHTGDRAGKGIERDGEHEQTPERDEGDPGGEERESDCTIRGNKH